MDKVKFNKALKMFEKYSKTQDFISDTQERDERRNYFKNIFKQKFNELVFSEIVKKLWAMQIWGNKDYVVDKILKDNNISKLQKEFDKLTSKKGTPGERYVSFLNNIKGMGPAMVTEILCYTDPQNAGIWNDKARKALAWLEVEDVPYAKYRLEKDEYDNFSNALKKIAKELKKNYKNIDLLFVDYFLWELWNNFIKGKEEIVKPEKVAKSLTRHDELREKVSQIGLWLGFEVEQERLIANGAKVDSIWRAGIANLGAVRYVFEIQDRGSIDSLIVNLQRSQTNPTVQKLIVVSDKDQIEKIKREIETMPESFRKAVVFWDTKEVDETHKNLEQVTESVAKLNLVKE